MAAHRWFGVLGSRGSQADGGVATKRRGGANRPLAARSPLALRKCGIEPLEDRRLLSINLISKNLELTLNDTTGAVTGLYQCTNGTPTGSSLITSGASFLAAIVDGSTYVAPTSFSYDSGASNLTFNFPSSRSTTIHVDQGTTRDYLTFTVSAFNGTLPTKMEVLDYFKTSLTDYVSDMSGINASDSLNFAVYVRSLSPAGKATAVDFNVDITPSNHIVGAKLALGGCAYGTNGSGVVTALASLVANEGLVTSSVGGPSALGASINKDSYTFASGVICNATTNNVPDWINLAKEGGIKILLITEWWQSTGHYAPRTANFPGGLDGTTGDMTYTHSLKYAADQIHDAGLEVGFHFLTTGIGTSSADPVNDSYLTSGDLRLGKDYSYTLNTGINPTATTIVMNGTTPAGLPIIWSYDGGNVIQIANDNGIGSELIQFTGYSSAGGTTTFTGCTRGRFGTTAASHTAGVAAGHLISYAYLFCADPDSTPNLLDEITTNVANVMNTCGADMVYLDGSEIGVNLYGVSKGKADIVSKINHAVRVEASNSDAYSWTFTSVVGTFDYPVYAEKSFIDSKLSSLSTNENSKLLPGTLGWWSFPTNSSNYNALLPDQMEYVCAKALGYNVPLAIMGVYPTALNGQQDNYMAMIAQWQSIDRSQLSSDLITRLKTAGNEFHLTTLPDGSLHLEQLSYDVKNAQSTHDGLNTADGHKVVGVTTSDTSKTWTLNNQYGTQYPTMQIESLHGVGSYDETSTTVTGTQADVSATTVTRNTGVSAATLTWSTAQYRSGQSGSMLFSATNSSATKTAAWAKAARTFAGGLDITGKDALGVWIYGDAKGEILNLQLFNAPGYSNVLDDHYVTVDFSGWKYFELPLCERDAEQYYDYSWPYSNSDLNRATFVNRAHVGGINIFYNNIPVGQTANCYISLVKALPVADVTLTNPAVTIGSTTITFPTTLTSGQYIEFNSMTDCKRYDQNGFLLGSITPTGTQPLLAYGNNTVTFGGTAQTGYNVRAMVSIGRYDVQTANWDAATVGTWSFSEASGSTAFDASSYLNNGTLSANVTRVAGRYGNGLQFNGTDTSVTIPNSTSLSSITGSFTAELWFKYTGAGATAEGVLLAKNATGSTYNNPFYIFVRASDSHLCARVGNGTTQYYGFDSGVAVNDGAFHQVALVYDDVAKTYRLYVDGGAARVTQSVASTWTIAHNTNSVTLGYWAGVGNYFNGVLDEVQILTRPLSQTEVGNRYNYGTYVPPTITVQPANRAVDVNQTATFVVEATGQGTLTYHWMKNGVTIVGATGAYYTVPSTDTAQGNNGDQYSVMITNDYGSVISGVATLYVNYGQQAWWKLDDASGTSAADASGNAHTGTLVNGPGWTSGILGGAVNLNPSTQNNQYVQVSDSDTLDNTSQLTISTWVYPRVLDGQPRGVISKRVGSYNTNLAYSLFFYTGNKLYVDIEGMGDRFSSNTVFSTNQWYHVAVTYDGSLAAGQRVKLYVNGVLDTTASESSSSIPNCASDLTVGILNVGYGYALNGIVDNARIYTHTLSAEAIAEQARCPVGYWKFDENTGTTAADASGNGNTGTRVNGPIWTTGGKFDGAISFDGSNDYVSVPAPAGSALKYVGGELTVSVWAYIDPTETTGGYLVSKMWNGGGYRNYFLRVDPSRTVTFYIGGQTSDWIASTATLSPGAWHRITGTVDTAKVMTLYFDGVSVASKTYSGITTWVPTGGGGDANLSLAIGTQYPYGSGWTGNTSMSFDGKLDSVCVFNQALVLSEVQMLNTRISISPELESVAVNDGAAQQSSVASLAVTLSNVVAMDGDGNGRAGGNRLFDNRLTDAFFRKFRDFDGDRDIDGLDLLRFKNSHFALSHFKWYFDFDGDEDTDGFGLGLKQSFI